MHADNGYWEEPDIADAGRAGDIVFVILAVVFDRVKVPPT